MEHTLFLHLMRLIFEFRTNRLCQDLISYIKRNWWRASSDPSLEKLIRPSERSTTWRCVRISPVWKECRPTLHQRRTTSVFERRKHNSCWQKEPLCRQKGILAQVLLAALTLRSRSLMQFFLTLGADPVNIFGELAGSEASGHHAARWHRLWPSFNSASWDPFDCKEPKEKLSFLIWLPCSQRGTLDNLCWTTADWILRSLSGVTEVRVAEEAITAGL